MAGLGLIIFPMIENKYLLFAPMTGFGIAWASMMGIPYLLVVNEIPKERYGVYMGIINMMIVIPMILQTLTFGFISKTFLQNDAGQAITFAGIFLLIAAAATLRIRENKQIDPTFHRFQLGINQKFNLDLAGFQNLPGLVSAGH